MVSSGVDPTVGMSVCQCMSHQACLSVLCPSLHSVGEEDEVSIRDVAFMIAEAMEFKGEVKVRTHLCLHA